MPSIVRLFVPADLAAGTVVTLSPGQAHYLGSVMRRGVGDPVRLFNGRDGEWAARLETLRRERAACAVERQTRPQAADPDVWLLFAPLKRDATALVIEKATELGVSRIQPTLTEHTNSRPPHPDRLEAIAIEAAEQCERLTIPQIAPAATLTEVLRDWPPGRRLVTAMERQGDPPIRPGSGPGALLVGPEGGFAAPELDVLRRKPFIVPASLGPRILRAETAVIAGLALLLLGRDD